MDMFLTHFHFLRPWMFLLLTVLAWLVYHLKQSNQAWAAWKKICDPELLAYLNVNTHTNTTSTRPLWWLGIAGLCIITALSGPVWKQLPQPIYRPASALVILLDLSLSMNAQDIKPSRLTRAKQKITDLLQLRNEGQTALIVFAGSAHIVTPLTEDSQTILSQLQALSTDMMPVQGGNLDAALKKALLLFQQTSIKHGVIIALTDSEAFTEASIKELTQAGHRIDVIGVGTSQGAPIPKASGGFVTDPQGNIVIPSLHENRLQRLATLGHGFYHPLSLNQIDIQPVFDQLSPHAWNQNTKQSSTNTHDMWYEEGPYLLLFIMPLVLLAFRRGVLVILVCLSFQPDSAQALEWQDLWQTKQHQGESLMADKKYPQAARTFENLAWKASAHYRAKNYAIAEKEFHAIAKPSIDDQYNHANSLAHLGKLDKAIASYDNILKITPQFSDAKTNKALLEKIKKQQSEKKESASNKQKNTPPKDKKQDSSNEKKSSGGGSKDKQAKQHNEKTDHGQAANSHTKNGTSKNKSSSPSKTPDDSPQSLNKPSKDKQNEAAKHDTEVAQNTKKSKQQSSQHALSPEEMKKLEAKQAFDQTIRRIPDDPGGLLRRKFLYQYQQQYAEKLDQGVTSW